MKIFLMIVLLISCDTGLESVEKKLGKPDYPLNVNPDYEEYYDVNKNSNSDHWSWKYVYYNYKNHKIEFTYTIDYVNEVWIIKREETELFYSLVESGNGRF